MLSPILPTVEIQTVAACIDPNEFCCHHDHHHCQHHDEDCVHNQIDDHDDHDGHGDHDDL